MILELDDGFESSDTLRTVLKLLTGDIKTADRYDWAQMKRYLNVKRFADKWECQQLSYVVDLMLENTFQSNARPDLMFTVFIIAANSENDYLCQKTIISVGGQADWGSLASNDRLSFWKGAAIDPAHWRLEDHLLCPPLYSWCLKRAVDTKDTAAARATEFKELLDLNKGLW